MHQYIYIKIYILRAFQILKYLVAPIFIRVHSPLFRCHFSTATFSHWLSRSWSRHQKLCEEWWPDGFANCWVLLFWVYSGFCSTSLYLVCVDRSGSLSSDAFNQLKLVTLNIVLTILYSLKSVSQWSLLQCFDSFISSTKSSNIYSRHPHCNIK